jgi:DNA-binding NarL/FixJ family response regulator
LAEIREELPQILICDLFMPGMSGFELLNLVRAQHPSIRSIAMCAMFSDDEIPTGVAADAFYRKGANLDFLLATVRMIAPVAPADPAQPFNNLQSESMANDEHDSPQAEPIRLRKQAGS